jgi:uncharacterized DUF497 family protein
VRITFHRAKFEKTLQERKLDFRRVVEIFAAVRVISMRKANTRELKALTPYLEGS